MAIVAAVSGIRDLKHVVSVVFGPKDEVASVYGNEESVSQPASRSLEATTE